MNFSYENQGVNTYLVYTIDKKDEIDTMSLGMLTNNRIPGLAPAIFQQMDTTKYMKFNISSKVSVKQFFTGAVNQKKLVGVFTGIVNAMLSAEEYMIDPETILLDLDYIYADVSTCETVLICLPVVVKKEAVDLGSFFKNLVFSTQFDQTENCDYVAKIINYLNSMSVFSLVDFKAILLELSRGGQEKKVMPDVPQKQQLSMQMKEATDLREQPPLNGKIDSIPQAGVGEMASKNVSKTGAYGGGKAEEIPLQSVSSLPVQNIGAEEKEISWFYLMQHYNKENAARYKAQKEQKKLRQATKVSSQKAETNKKGREKKSKGGAQQSFAVPGQSYAVPGQASFAPGVKGEMVLPGASTPQVQPKITEIVQQMGTISDSTQSKIVTGNANFGETTVLGTNNIGETTVLSGMQQTKDTPKPYLIRMKNNEKIPLDKPVYRIGKEKSYVDYFIGDNTAISRSHANIITREGEYYVVDTNSTNHTYVNDVMIQSNAETMISNGTKLRLANEEFEFRML